MKIRKALRATIVLFIGIAFILSATLTSCFNVLKPQVSVPEKSDNVSHKTTDTTSIDVKEQNQPESTSSQESETSDQPQDQKEETKDMIKVTFPKPGDTISSPLLIEGEARGNWYFEASFPVKLLDAEGNIVAMHYAQAQGDWMTEEFVPFTSELIFEAPPTETGILILQKDNPSGLPENDASIEIPVKFSKDKK